jgi:hypothetical protein
MASGTEDIVNVVWPATLIPPEIVMVMGSPVAWHPCLLVEISPIDGPSSAGNHVWDYNNLCQRNVSINYVDSDSNFSSLIIAGNLENKSEYFYIVIEREKVPSSIRVFLEILDPKALRRLRELVQKKRLDDVYPGVEVTFLDSAKVAWGKGIHGNEEQVISVPANSFLKIGGVSLTYDPAIDGYTFGNFKGHDVVWLSTSNICRIPILAGSGVLVPVRIGTIGPSFGQKKTFELGIMQYDTNGKVMGSAAISVRSKKAA